MVSSNPAIPAPLPFRPCIDLHEGRVKQIVGGSLRDGERPETNFETDRSSSWFADLYRRDGLAGGHVILLGPGNESAARQALTAWPGGLQVGGGVTAENARAWLEAGASHVIVTSYVFREGLVDWEHLSELTRAIGRERLVLDLSCRRRPDPDGSPDRYFVVTDRWQKFTETEICPATLERLAGSAAEFLIHAADIEGRQQGIDLELVELLARHSPIPATYAGGARGLEDLRTVWQTGRGRLGLTIGSALDLFGGPIPYREVVTLARELAAMQ